MFELLLAYLQRPETVRALTCGCLVAARTAPVTWIAPWLGLRSAPPMIRTGVCVVLTLALAPVAFARMPHVPTDATFVLLLLREALLGSIFAIITATPFFALEQGGRLVDLYRGANLAEVLAPPTGERTSPYGDLAILGGLALFASLGGVRLALGVFAEGFVTLPVGATPATSFGALSLDAAKALTSALTFAAVSAMPAAISIMVAELALGLVARAVPKISVFFLGMPLRAMLGLALGLLSVGVVLDRAVTEAEVAARSAGRVLR